MVETITYKRRARALGLLLTLLVTGSIVTVLLLIILRTPIPPYPEGGGGQGDGIELNLGFADAGMGDVQQDVSTTAPEPATQAKQENEKLMTQDVEDAPSINEADVKKPKKEVKKEVAVPKKETEKPKQPVVNQNALYRPKTNQTSSNGDKNVAGDQGNPNGNLAAKAFSGKGGQGGSGGGTGGGTGTGTGTGVGDGVVYDLGDRHAVGALPMPEYNKQEEGTVVVEVIVDKDGKVTQAVAGVKGTTTPDESLRRAAREAALKARFEPKPSVPFQQGKITYKFRLQ